MPRVAITGGIAMGKSTALEIVSSFGRSTASADEIARSVLDDPTIQSIVAKSLRVSLPIDRGELRERISDDPAARRALNDIVHPETRRRMLDCDADFIEVPLLIESCLYAEFESVWVVSCPFEVQLRRLVERLGAEDRARRLIEAQLPIEVKEVFGNEVIRTNLPRTSVRDHIGKLLESVETG